MSPEITDKIGRPSATDQFAAATTVTVDRVIGGTVLSCFDLSTFAEDTPVYFITYKKNVDPITNVVTITNQTGWKALASVDTNTLTNLTIAPGYVDIGNEIGDYVECVPTSYWGNELVDWTKVEHNPDGTHTAITADSIVVADGGTLDVDTINEATSGAGVTADGVLFKDGKLNTANSVVVSNLSADGSKTIVKSVTTNGWSESATFNSVSTLSLGAGCWLIIGSVNFDCATTSARSGYIRLYNTTDSSAVSGDIRTRIESANAENAAVVTAFATITLAGTKTIALQAKVSDIAETNTVTNPILIAIQVASIN